MLRGGEDLRSRGIVLTGERETGGSSEEQKQEEEEEGLKLHRR